MSITRDLLRCVSSVTRALKEVGKLDGESGPGKLCAECEISTQERPAGKEEGGNFSLLSRRDWTIP